MGKTGQEKLENFFNCADRCLTENGYDSTTAGNIKAFIKFVSEKQKPLDEYDTQDFKEFFKEHYQKISSFASVKTRLTTFLKTVGEESAAEVLDDVEISYRTNYIKDFDTLYNSIQEVRLKEMPSSEFEYCDKFTMGEVILYLAWIGVPQNTVLQIPLSAIDLNKKVVSAGKEYSFADYPQIEEVFTKYKNSTTFVGIRNVGDKTHFVTNPYFGDKIIRTRKKTESNINIKTLLTRVFSSFEFAGSYFNVFRSGQLYRGYQKYLNGEKPDFKSFENIWDYFGIALTSDPERYSFKKSWLIYLNWIEENK